MQLVTKNLIQDYNQLKTNALNKVTSSCCYPVPYQDYPPTTSSPALAPLSYYLSKIRLFL